MMILREFTIFQPQDYGSERGFKKLPPKIRQGGHQKSQKLMFLPTGSFSTTKAVISLPLRPASLTHKNPQRRKIIRTKTTNERSEDVL